MTTKQSKDKVNQPNDKSLGDFPVDANSLLKVTEVTRGNHKTA